MVLWPQRITTRFGHIKITNAHIKGKNITPQKQALVVILAVIALVHNIKDADRGVATGNRELLLVRTRFVITTR